jgi:hypothetical protein
MIIVYIMKINLLFFFKFLTKKFRIKLNFEGDGEASIYLIDKG